MRTHTYLHSLTHISLVGVAYKITHISTELFFLKQSMDLPNGEAFNDLKNSADKNFITLIISSSNLGI